MFGDYFGLRRDYPVEEWINDIVPQGVDQVGACHRHVGPGPRARRDALAAIGRRQARLSARHRLQCRSGRSRLDATLKAQKQFPNLRGVREQMLYWDSDPLRQARQPAGLLQRARFPPRLCAAGEIRPAFRIAGLRRAGEIRRRADQGVSNVRMILVHAGMLTDAHAAQDRTMARGAHRDGGVPQSAREAFRASACSATASPFRRRAK